MAASLAVAARTAAASGAASTEEGVRAAAGMETAEVGAAELGRVVEREVAGMARVGREGAAMGAAARAAVTAAALMVVR